MKEFHSYGMIVIDANAKEKKVLMVCRKDSIGFCEFIKGKYNPKYKNELYKLFSYMTKDELEFLKFCSFYEAYNKLWNTIIDTSIEPPNYIIRQKYKFDNYRNIWFPICKSVIQKKRFFLDAEWGFPKGKKENGETSQQCAFRELYEETGINEGLLDIKEHEMITEIREDGNAKYFSHYHVAHLKEKESATDIEITPQKTEISIIRFEPLKSAYKLIRPYFTERIKIIKNLL